MKNLGENTGKLAFMGLKIFAWGLLAVFALMIFAFFCIVLLGKKDSTSTASTMTASLLDRLGLQKKKTLVSNTDSDVKLPLYKMLEDYTFYGYSDSTNIVKKYKKDEIFYGKVKQFDASFGMDRTTNTATIAVMKDFILRTGEILEVGIPVEKCRLLTAAETDEYNRLKASLI